MEFSDFITTPSLPSSSYLIYVAACGVRGLGLLGAHVLLTAGWVHSSNDFTRSPSRSMSQEMYGWGEGTFTDPHTVWIVLRVYNCR